MATRRRTAPVMTVVRTTDSSRALYQRRLKLLDEIKRAEYQFTRRPTHLSAAKLTVLRTLANEIEMEIVNLDLTFDEKR